MLLNDTKLILNEVIIRYLHLFTYYSYQFSAYSPWTSKGLMRQYTHLFYDDEGSVEPSSILCQCIEIYHRVPFLWPVTYLELHVLRYQSNIFRDLILKSYLNSLKFGRYCPKIIKNN